MRESVNGQVSVARTRPRVIMEAEKAGVWSALRRLQELVEELLPTVGTDDSFELI